MSIEWQDLDLANFIGCPDGLKCQAMGQDPALAIYNG